MRSLVVALAGLALLAPAAPAAVVEIRENFCGCDGSSGDEDTQTLIVRAEPRESNRLTIRLMPRGVLIEDSGAPLIGRCRPSRSGGRFCRGVYEGTEVELGDGDDEIRVSGGSYLLSGGPGADRLDATGALHASVSYAERTEGVAISLNGFADDGAPGEGDNVLGPVTGLTGGAGDDRLEAGPTASGLFGAGGDDTLVGSPERDTLHGGGGDDQLFAGDGNDSLTGAEGADGLGGGPGPLDEVSYGGAAPLRLSIGDGPNDGAEGEGDDIGADIEALTGGSGPDVLIGDEDRNRLIGYGGQDVLRGLDGDDDLIGWGDGDELDAGAGADFVQAGASDRALLLDGRTDRLACGARTPAIEADLFDELRQCAPRVTLRPRRGPRGRALLVMVRCPSDSAIPCQGRVWTHLIGGRKLSRRAYFGPVAPGEYEVARVHFRTVPRRGTDVCVSARTRRHDDFVHATATPGGPACRRR